MPLEFLKLAGFDRNSLLQQIQDHFADGVDLVAVGVGQQFLSSLSVGFLEDPLQERRLSTYAVHTSQGA